MTPVFCTRKTDKEVERVNMKVFLQCLCIISYIQSINCSAVISIELLTYTNPRGTNVFGQKCDEFPGGPELPCDPSFHFCVSPRPKNGGSCLWTNIWLNKNTIKFSRGIEIAPGRSNPLLYEFGSEFQDELMLNVVARDEDGLFDDQMDMLKANIQLDGKTKSKVVTLKGEISNLSLRITVLCINKDLNCNTRCTPILNKNKVWICKEIATCVPRNDERGHYECDEITGKKKCLPGWKDVSKDCTHDARSEVSCSTNYMRIDIDRTYFNPAKYSTITLLDSSCKATVSKFHITLDSIPQNCGSKRVQTDDYIVYENEVNMKAIPTDALITREHDVRIRFKCSYNRSDDALSKSFRPLTNIDVQEDAAFTYSRPDELYFSYGKKGFSILKFYIQLYRDSSYKQLQTNFPLTINLNESIYLEVNSTSTDDDLVLLIDRCYATPSLDFNHPLKHVFIENGCSKDKTVTFFKGNRKKKRFSLNTFTFIKRSLQVYFHCVTLMCRKSSTEAKCIDGCNGDILNRARRGIQTQSNGQQQSYTKYYLVNIGPIKRNINHENHFGDHDQSKEEIGSSSELRVVLIVGVSIFGLIAIAMFIRIMRRRHGSQAV